MEEDSDLDIWDFLILIFLYWVNYRSDGSIYSNPRVRQKTFIKIQVEFKSIQINDFDDEILYEEREFRFA